MPKFKVGDRVVGMNRWNGKTPYDSVETIMLRLTLREAYCEAMNNPIVKGLYEALRAEARQGFGADCCEECAERAGRALKALAALAAYEKGLEEEI